MNQPTAFLESLLDAPGPSGFEVRPARVWRAEAETFADSVTTDVSGNTFAVRLGTGHDLMAHSGLPCPHWYGSISRLLGG